MTLSRHRKNQTPTPDVSVANNDLNLLKWIKSKIGGSISSKKKRLPHHKDSYVWGIKQDRAIRFLKEVKKYLIVKRKQADLIVSDYKKVTHPAGKYTADMLKKKEELVKKIRLLNQR